MATVQRANVILQVADEPDIIQRYKDKGYNVIEDATGVVLERAVPHDSNALQILVSELQRELEEKTAAISKLEKENKKLRKRIKEVE